MRPVFSKSRRETTCVLSIRSATSLLTRCIKLTSRTPKSPHDAGSSAWCSDAAICSPTPLRLTRARSTGIHASISSPLGNSSGAAFGRTGRSCTSLRWTRSNPSAAAWDIPGCLRDFVAFKYSVVRCSKKSARATGSRRRSHGRRIHSHCLFLEQSWKMSWPQDGRVRAPARHPRRSATGSPDGSRQRQYRGFGGGFRYWAANRWPPSSFLARRGTRGICLSYNAL